MDGSTDCHIQWNKSDTEDKYHMISLIVELKKKKNKKKTGPNELIYKTEVESQMQKTNLRSIGNIQGKG